MPRPLPFFLVFLGALLPLRAPGAATAPEARPTVLRVALEPDLTPLLGGDASAPRGLAWDYLHRIVDTQGMRLEAVPAASAAGAAEALAAGRVDVRVAAAATPGTLPSLPWLRAPCAVYVAAAARPLRVEELDGHSVAGAPGEPCAVALRQTVPGAKLHGYDTIASALRALAAGKVDAYVGDLVTSQGALSRLGLRGRTRIGAQFAGEGATFRFLVRGDNTTLLHRLDSGLQGIDADTERRLRARWLQDLLPEPATAASETSGAPALPAGNAEAIAKAQSALAAQPGLDAAQRQQAEAALSAALADEKTADAAAESARTLRAAAERAAQDLPALEQRLGQDNTPALLAWRASLPERAAVEQFEALLASERSALADARSAAGAQQAELGALLERPAPLRDELKAAQVALEQAQQPTPPPAPGVPAAVAEAMRLRQAAAVRLAQARVAALEEELRGYEIRLRYASAQLRERQRLAGEAQQKVERLQALVLDRTSAAVAELNARLRSEAQAQAGAARPLQEAAAANVGLGEELARAVARLGDVRQLRDRDAAARREAEESLRNTNERLKVGGLSEAVGLILLTERRKLKPAAVLARDLARLQTELAQARMRLIDLREMARALEDPGTEVQTELRRLTEGSDGPATGLQAGLYRLLSTRAEILPRLIAAQTRLSEALGDAEQELRGLAATSQTLRLTLDERLLWTPSHAAVDGRFPADVGAAAWEFLRPTRWWESLKRVALTAWARPLWSSLGLAALGALLVWRRRVPADLAALALPTRRIRSDRYRYTGQALWLSLAASAAAPMALWLASRLWLRAAEPGYPFSDAIGTTLGSLIWPLAALSFCGWLARPDGLAAVHFRWAAARRHALQRLRRGLLWTLLPVQFVVGVLFFSGEAVYADDRLAAGLGRAVFLLGLLAFAALAWRALAPGALWAQRVAAREPNRARQALRLGLAAFTLGLSALTLAGYYLTAISLAARLIESLIVLLAIALLHGLAMRWLVLGERRLALKRRDERREEGEVADDDHEARPELGPESESITLASINLQTRRLLRALTLLGLVGSLLWVWSDVAPALSYLGNITAWTTSVSVDGKAHEVAVSLRQLLYAFVALLLTWVGTRNLPGLLEIGVLRRLQVDAPTRYAITAVCRYAIAIAGSLLGLSWLGLRWSQLQWLAAGLTVGLGFGLQEVFANFVSGLIVLFERPIRVGDVVSIAGIEGSVARIRTRATTVVDWDNREVVIPNKTFITEKLTNWTLTDGVTRVVIKLGVAYDSDPEGVRAMLLELARAHPRVLREPPPNCWCVALGSSTLDFELRVFVADVIDRNPVRNDLHGAILRECRVRGIEIAFPQTDVWLRNAPPLQAAPSAAATNASKRD